MKKFLATMAALAVVTAAFTGCSNNNNSGSDSSASDSSSSASDSSSTASDSSSTASDNSSTASTAESSKPETTTRTAEDIANAVFESVDWVAFEQVTDAEVAETMLGLDLSLLDEYSIYVPMMSVHLDELIIVKPKSGSEADVEKQLSDHLDYIKNGAAFYPEQEIAAAGAVMGQTDDGFYYLVVHQIGSQIADVIKTYQPGDEVQKLEVPEPDYGDDGVTVVPTEEQGSVIVYSDSDASASKTAEAAIPDDGAAVVY